MTPPRLRATVIALLLGVGGSLGVTSAQAAVGSTACLTGTAATTTPVRIGGVAYRRDNEPSVPASVAAQVQRQLAAVPTRRAAAPLPTTFIVRAHIILGTRKQDRNRHATRGQVRRQVAWLNAAYAGGEAPATATESVDTGVRFRLRSTTVTRNNAWAHPRTLGALFPMKKLLHHGNQRTLNLYFTTLPHGTLGFAAFPWSYRGHPRLDGVVIDYRAITGGRFAAYTQGDTAVHETGHWLGLLHTFQGYDGFPGSGCEGTGDGVADTPAEGEPQFRCTQVDTCPAPGLDPIHNFMDYSLDSCLYEFTAGQVVRIGQAITAYRS